MHADIERGIRKRIDHNRAAAKMGDGYRQAAVDREILILELDKLRKNAVRIRHELNVDPSNDSQTQNMLCELLDQLLGADPADAETKAPEHHPV